MCLAFFEGKGYSSNFPKHMTEIKGRLKENPLVSIIGTTDEICAACPNNREGVCESAQKVAEYDRQVLLRCGITEGEVMPFLDFEKRVYDNILYSGKREEICGNCQWNSLCCFKDR